MKITEDRAYQDLKSQYGVETRDLVGSLTTVETTQPGKKLQVFDNPRPGKSYVISWSTSELTSLCPKTGQPDFCNLYVEYVPEKVCLELKSAKLYLWSYRNEGHFYEELINLIYDDFHAALNPKYLKVRGEFWVRGGMSETVEVSSKED